MIYPEFLKKNSTIGISAPSAGVGKKLDDFDASLSYLRAHSWKIRETESVRLNDVRGGDAPARGRELTSLFADPEVDFVLSAAGVCVATIIINSFIRNVAGVLITVLSFGVRQVVLLLAVSIIVAFAASFLPVKKIAAKRPIDAIRGR